MKNLFKNLMLVAVVAMAFTACHEDNGELDAPKRIINFTANIGGDDTRSGFVGSESTEDENGESVTVYKSAWDGGENIKLYADNGPTITTTIDAEGKFTAEFEGEPSNNLFITVCSPAEAWPYPYQYTIPAEQTPRADSVDPDAHILQAQGINIGKMEDDISFSMEHVAAYGKMKVNTPTEFAIDKVEIELIGKYVSAARELSYTINATNVEENIFWFATEPITVSKMTVKAYGKEAGEDKIYSKTISVEEGKLYFDTGRVGSFSVSNLNELEIPKFTSAKMVNDDMSDKLIQFESAELGTLQLNFYNCNNSNWIDCRTYTFTYSGEIWPGDSYSWYTDSTGESYPAEMGSVIVSAVNGKYHIEFKDVTDYNISYTLNATFTGTIEGLQLPDTRSKLPTPTLTHETNGRSVTLSWEAIDGAVGYRVQCSDGEIDTTTTETSITLEFAEYEGYYIFVGAIAAANDPNYRNSDESYVFVKLEDPRTVLPTPANVAATVDGKYATIKWDPVQGADYYQLYYNLNGEYLIDATECSITLDLGYGIKDLWIYVFAKANNDNPDYSSSLSFDSYVIVNTERDPNIFADVMFTSLTWDSVGRFILNDDNGWRTTQLYLSPTDRPNNNSIVPDTYTYDLYSLQNPGSGKFGIRNFMGYSSEGQYLSESSTMTVKFEDGQYKILIHTYSSSAPHYNDLTLGYIGMPDWMVAPEQSGSGDSGEGSGPIVLDSLTFYEAAGKTLVYKLRSSDNQHVITLVFNNQDVLANWIPKYTYISQGLNIVNGSTGYFSLKYEKPIINGSTVNVDNAGSTLKVNSSTKGGNHDLELNILTSAGETYNYVFNGIIE